VGTRAASFLKAAAIAAVVLLAVDRFLPGIPLSFLASDSAPKPNALKEPVQEVATNAPFRETRGSRTFRLTPRASYDVAARVGRTERYRWGASGALIPWDFVLAWGAVAKEPAWSHVSYLQTGRFYNWRCDDTLDPGYVASHSANTHLIPASGRIAFALAHARRGDLVRLEGDLVDVEGPGGFVWKTSLTRTDTGPGACETLYVRAVTIGGRRYR